ncbi:Predicted regulator of Ras-like GTPase activity, Roadblock/LC7/MglB family [Thermus arciformis]|uniref:Predicted regulator of Ras-like GTPase activity, Roadblock/LC7/MglB family n=1 Tax=Thermus arciformis TaxID=482827 RepID=A0A1G7CRJ3_9DEIN|nr:hypothetical protein [Thermus arciformis]SDE41380.1 Predicted regulator of Ras-like GTPase activity, Roadblock/LC7/MglB family [Thermus arciformis]
MRQPEAPTETLLHELLTRVDGAFAAALGTLEGLLVEGVGRRRVDLEAAVAEHAALLRQAQAAYAGSLFTPRVEELLVGGHPVVGYARMVGARSPSREGKGLFLLLLLEAGGNLGQARRQAAKAAERLLEVAGWLT